MVDWTNPQVLWLNITNIALGLVCLVSFVLVLGAVTKAVWARAKSRAHSLAGADTHSMIVPELGTTMADGGHPVGEKADDEGVS